MSEIIATDFTVIIHTQPDKRVEAIGVMRFLVQMRLLEVPDSVLELLVGLGLSQNWKDPSWGVLFSLMNACKFKNIAPIMNLVAERIEDRWVQQDIRDWIQILKLDVHEFPHLRALLPEVPGKDPKLAPRT